MKAWMFGLVWLGGCANLHSPDPASPYYAYPAGWQLVLHQPLTIPADSATVRLQYGRVVPRNGVQDADPFCVVELNTVRESPQTLAPGRFAITRVTRSVSDLATVSSPLRKVGFGHDDAPSFLYFRTDFALHDAAQPELLAMHCAWNQMAPGNRGLMRHLTVPEIQSALGDWLTLQPPRSAP